MSARRATLAAGALLAALAAQAQDKPATTNAGEATISSAKKDFDTIKASRDGALQQKADLPSLGGVPDLPAGNENLPHPWATKKDELFEKQKKRKSENWLLDAMEKEKKSEKSGATPKDRDEAKLPGDEKLSDDDKTASDESVANANKDRDTRPTVAVNPLTRYMSEWMTPQDFALLQTTGGANAKDGGSGTALSTANLPGVGSTGGSGVEASLAGVNFGEAAAAKSAAATASQENPFLAGLGSTGGSNLTFTPPAVIPPPPASSTPPIFQAPTPEPAPVRSNVPDFAKPADDARALKPMKRF